MTRKPRSGDFSQVARQVVQEATRERAQVDPVDRVIAEIKADPRKVEESRAWARESQRRAEAGELSDSREFLQKKIAEYRRP